MHIAVSKGADAGESFKHYVGYLYENHYISKDAEAWVDHIHEKANEQNHEIVIAKEEDAKRLLDFCGILLKSIFEFSAKLSQEDDESSGAGTPSN